jgi:hypothetical protein
MTAIKSRWAAWIGVVFGVGCLGCSMTPQALVPTGSGAYAGVTSAGERIVLNLQQDGRAVRGHGTVGAEPFAVAGPLAWTAVGSLLQANGSAATRELRLSADGEELILTTPGGVDEVLVRQGDAAAGAAGPFAGSYEGTDAGGALVRAVITQSGSLLAGAGTLFGQPAGITGRVTSGTLADGILILADGSQARFQAELSADGQSVAVRGLGAPTTLRRRR